MLINADFTDLDNMPPVDIDPRETDKRVIYNKTLNRLDTLAGDIYEDETMWKVILWANPNYEIEYDIPDNEVIRVPWPKREVLDEVTQKIITRKNLG